MKRLLLILIVLGLGLTIVDCKKQNKSKLGDDQSETEIQPIPVKNFLTIDSTNSDVKITKTNIKINNSQLIDADGDNNPDFEFTFFKFMPYINEVGSYYYEYNVYYAKIEYLNEEASILSDSLYYERGTWCGDYLLKVDSVYPKNLLYKDSIQVSEKWRRKQMVIIKTEVGKSYSGCGRNTSTDTWLKGEIGYIGIKVKNRLGWIKISNADNIGINYYEYALMK